MGGRQTIGCISGPSGHRVGRWIGGGPAPEDLDPALQVVALPRGGVPVGYDTFKAEIPYKDDEPGSLQQLNFGVAPGCINTEDGSNSTAIPPVREREVAEAFAEEGERNLFSICQDDYSAALQAIADKLIDQIKPACMTRCVLDTDTSTPFAEPNCDVADVDIATGAKQVIPPCVETEDGYQAPAMATACYAYLGDKDGDTPSTLDDMSDYCADVGFNLEFQILRSAAAPTGTSVTATCQLSDNVKRDCPLL